VRVRVAGQVLLATGSPQSDRPKDNPANTCDVTARPDALECRISPSAASVDPELARVVAAWPDHPGDRRQQWAG
jgi:hypothetical protein